MHTDVFGAGEVAFFKRLHSFGYVPTVIYDIGASNGHWSETIQAVFPQAKYHLFEPLSGNYPKYDDTMGAMIARYPNCQLHPIALGNETGTIKFFCAKDGYSSSAHSMPQSLARELTVPSWRLDEYVTKHKLPVANILKLDVQGCEAMVLEGAGLLVGQADVIFMETWFNRGYGPNTPLITEFVEALRPLDFVLVDISGPYYGDFRELTSIDAFFLSKALLHRIKSRSNGWRW
jgi:FkbM family methyltransferase